MSNKLKLLIDFFSYNSDKPTNDPSSDSTKIINLVKESSYNELCRKQVEIADAETDVNITLADAASDYLLLFTDQEITIKLNGSDDALTIKPQAIGTKTLGLVLKGDVTALTVSNASGNSASLDVISINL